MNKNETFLKYFNFSISTQTISSKEKKELKQKKVGESNFHFFLMIPL